MMMSEPTYFQRRIRTAGFLFFLGLIAVSITSTFLGVLRGLDSKAVRDPIPPICPQPSGEVGHG